MQGLSKGPVYVFRCHVGGKKSGPRIKRVLGKIPYKEACRKALILLQRYGALRPDSPAAELTIEELSEEVQAHQGPEVSPVWYTAREATWRLHLRPAFGKLLVSELAPTHLKAFRNQRLAAGMTNATVNRELSILTAALNQAAVLGLIPHNPIPRGAVTRLREERRTVFFAPEEWTRFLAAFDEREQWASIVKAACKAPFGRPQWNRTPAKIEEAYQAWRALRDYFRTLLYVGGRLSEVLTLRWTDVDLKAGTILLYQSKTARRKRVHVAAELAQLLAAVPRSGQPGGKQPKPDQRVFCWPDGSDISRNTIHKAFAVARQIAGIRPELTIHSIRHTTGSWLAGAGYSAKVIQDVLGHAGPGMTDRYMHLAPAHVAEAFAAISAAGSATGDPKVTPTPRGNLRNISDKRKP